MTPDARLFMRYLKWLSTVQRLLLADYGTLKLTQLAAVRQRIH